MTYLSEEIKNVLPTEICNKIYMMLPPHPIMEALDFDRDNMLAFEGFGQTWEEFVEIQLCRYKDKCRKKPKHCDIMKNAIRRHKDRNKYLKTNTPFLDYCFSRV